jgi:hypothetical protein
MIRKQIYIQRRQQAILRRQARALRVSEAALIRQALDRQARSGSQVSEPDPDAWEQAHRFMLAMMARGPLRARRRRWTRDELYDDRVGHNARRAD